MTDTDIWNWISAFIQSFAETFLLVNVYCAFLGQPRIKKYVAYSLISCFAIAYCVFINVFTLPTYLRYSLSLCVFFAYSMAWNGPGWKRLFAVCTDVTINALASSIVYWLIDFMRTDRGTCLTIDSVLFATPNVLILVTISMIFRYFYSSAWENLKVSPLQWLILTLYPGVAFLVTISLFSIPVWDIGNHILLIVDAVGLLLAMVIHFVLVDLLNEHNTKTKQDKLLHQQIQMESEKANALYDVYLQQRHLTHDFTNQLNTIAGLLEQGDTASALDLIRSSSTEIHINTLVVNTGNPMIDTLLAPPAMVDIALAMDAPPCCSRMARPSETAPHTMRKPPRKVTHPETRLMMFASIRHLSFPCIPNSRRAGGATPRGAPGTLRSTSGGPRCRTCDPSAGSPPR